MKNVAIVTQGYYPNMSPVSAVFDKYIQLMKGDYYFHVIALQSKVKYEPLCDQYITVYDMTSFWWRLRLKYEEKYKQKPNFISKVIVQLIRMRGTLLGLIEDYRQLKWLENCTYEMLNSISQKVEIDAVISVSGLHYFLHCGVMKFKVEHPKVRWITFITDPISFSSPEFKLVRFNEERKFRTKYSKEKEIYSIADYNIFTESLYYDALNKFHQPKEKTIHFNFVLDKLQTGQFVNRHLEDSNSIKLVYAGTLYRKIRNPEYMLSIISKIHNLHLDLYVRSIQCMDVLEKYKSDSIMIHDGVSPTRYKDMICNEYDVLINIGNNCENQLPSKTLELLSSGRPIINFYYHKDSQYEMIQKYPLGLNVGRDDVDAVSKVDAFCNKMRGKQLSFEEVEKLYPDNCLDRQKQILESLINS